MAHKSENKVRCDDIAFRNRVVFIHDYSHPNIRQDVASLNCLAPQIYLLIPFCDEHYNNGKSTRKTEILFHN